MMRPEIDDHGGQRQMFLPPQALTQQAAPRKRLPRVYVLRGDEHTGAADIFAPAVRVSVVSMLDASCPGSLPSATEVGRALDGLLAAFGADRLVDGTITAAERVALKRLFRLEKGDRLDPSDVALAARLIAVLTMMLHEQTSA